MKDERLIDLFATQQANNPFDFAYENLNAAMRSFLANGRIEPGTILPPYPLANALGVSRTTILKTLSCLMEENWVSLNEKKKYVVAKPTMKSILDVLVFRQTIEPAIVRLVAKNITDEGLEELRALLENFRHISIRPYVSDDELRSYVDVELAFHDKLAELCANSYLARAWEINHSRITQQIWLTLKSCNSNGFAERGYATSKPYAMHQQLFSAIQERNVQVAMGVVYSQLRNLDLEIYKPYTA